MPERLMLSVVPRRHGPAPTRYRTGAWIEKRRARSWDCVFRRLRDLAIAPRFGIGKRDTTSYPLVRGQELSSAPGNAVLALQFPRADAGSVSRPRGYSGCPRAAAA